MEIVTGFQGKNHVTAQQLSRLISGLAGDETYVLDTQDQLAIEVVSANKVTIATGDLIAQGTYFTNEAPEDLVIENGVTGLNRNDLIVCRYEKAEPAVDEDGNPDYTIPRIESGDWAVVKGTPSSGTPEDPSVVTASLQDPNTSLAEFPVYRIPIRGLSVGTPERIPPVIPSMREACDSLSQTLEGTWQRISGGKGNGQWFNSPLLGATKIILAVEHDAHESLIVWRTVTLEELEQANASNPVVVSSLIEPQTYSISAYISNGNIYGKNANPNFATVWIYGLV